MGRKKRLPLWERLRIDAGWGGDTSHVPGDAIEAFTAGLGRFVMDDCHGFWLEPDTGDGHCDPEQFITDIAQRINALCDTYNSQPTQSPIEDKLLGALMWLDLDWCGFPSGCDFGPAERLEVCGPRDQIDFWVTPQAKVGPYRVDLLVWLSYGKTVAGLVVECDGHDFHEKTKDQASRDKKRDREILKAGFPVVRFSGRDIYRSPAECVEQIRELLEPARDIVSRKAGLYGGAD